MTSHTILDENMLARARELRLAGRSPKEIARALGVRPATVAPLMRAIAQETTAATKPEPAPAVIGCWVSPGWSEGLTVNGPAGWPDNDVSTEGTSGLVGVAVARRRRTQRVSVCGYLVDVYCLGVKNALGPEAMNEHELPDFLSMFFSAFGGVTPIKAPLELARHLVWGAVDYARGLGFSPHPDFRAASGHLGKWQETSDITFGRDGTPCYMQGPHDNPKTVLRTLAKSVGEGNFPFIVPVGIR